MATIITAEGIDVLEATIVSSRTGAITADLVVDSQDETTFLVGSQVRLSLGGKLDVIGVVKSGDPAAYVGTKRPRFVGGAGGLAVEVPAMYFQQGQLRDPLRHALSAGGESQSTSIEEAVLSTQLQRWALAKQPVAEALDALALAAGVVWRVLPNGVVWRVLPNGTVWLGAETWPQLEGYDFDVVARHPEQRTIELAAAYPLVMAGQRLITAAGEELGNVEHVEHVVREDAVRSTVWVS